MANPKGRTPRIDHGTLYRLWEEYKKENPRGSRAEFARTHQISRQHTYSIFNKIDAQREAERRAAEEGSGGSVSERDEVAPKSETTAEEELKNYEPKGQLNYYWPTDV